MINLVMLGIGIVVLAVIGGICFLLDKMTDQAKETLVVIGIGITLTGAVLGVAYFIGYVILSAIGVI